MLTERKGVSSLLGMNNSDSEELQLQFPCAINPPFSRILATESLSRS
jgi:hypothetical protein